MWHEQKVRREAAFLCSATCFAKKGVEIFARMKKKQYLCSRFGKHIVQQYKLINLLTKKLKYYEKIITFCSSASC